MKRGEKSGSGESNEISSHVGHTNSVKGLLVLFQNGLRDMYRAEKSLGRILPKLTRQATATALVNALSIHYALTLNHTTRLETVFSITGMKPEGKECEAMAGLLQEAEAASVKNSGPLRDAAIIAALQKIDHYKIAAYGSLCTFASTLEETDALGLLEENLVEEKETDETLSELAASGIHIEKAVEVPKKH